MNARLPGVQGLFFTLLTLGATSALTSACASTTGERTGGTETGNPPRIARDKITVHEEGGALYVRGDAGAVTPRGTPITVTNTTTGDVFEGTSERDGAFDIAVEGDPSDTFEVRAEGSTDVATVKLESTVSMECDGYEQESRERLTEELMTADRQCTLIRDCVAVGPGSDCAGACNWEPLSLTGSRQVAQAREAVNGSICEDFASAECPVYMALCQDLHESLACVSGRCEKITDGHGCDDCIGAAGLSWQVIGLGSFPVESIEECRTYRSEGTQTCSNEIPSCGEPAEYHVDAVLRALASDAVETAFREGNHLGIELGTDESFLRIERGGEVFDVGSQCPEGAPPSCIPVPDAVLALKDVLVGLSEQQSSLPGGCD